MKADLHVHSLESDGTCAPEELADIAKNVGVSCLSLTDHDTISGIDTARDSCAAAGVAFIPGVEISVYSGEQEVHLLGYGMKDTYRLKQTFVKIRGMREMRMRQMIDKLNRMSIEIAYDDIAAYSSGSMGRAHLARALTERGYVQSIREAFDRYLSPGKSAFVPREKFSVRQAVELLLDAGAIPTLAHPGLIPMSDMLLFAGMERWRRYGLAGLEAHHPGHSPQTCFRFDRWARRHGMFVTGGSDYHGDMKPQVVIGDGIKYWDKIEEDVSRLIKAIN